MPDPNLTAALAGTLQIIDENPASPLSEATPDSVDLYLDRINQHLIDGAPEKITDDELLRVVTFYRAKALLWGQEEQTKKARSTKPRKPAGAVIEIDLL